MKFYSKKMDDSLKLVLTLLSMVTHEPETNVKSKPNKTFNKNDRFYDTKKKKNNINIHIRLQ